MWSGNIWYVRSGSGIIYYNDGNGQGGIDYTASSGTYRHITTVRIPNFPYIGFAVRTNGGISYKQIFVQGINNLGGEIPSSYSLSQNYPNPFNPVTKITFDIPNDLRGALATKQSLTPVQMSIYDVLGREVATLVNEHLKPGTYQVDWDATNYPSGIYFYRIVSGEFSDTRRMVLVK